VFFSLLVALTATNDSLMTKQQVSLLLVVAVLLNVKKKPL